MTIELQGMCAAVGEFRLEDITLAVHDEEYFVLLGPTGSGKTVLLECVAGLRRVAGGTIRIDGVDATQMEPRRRGIGYVPQDYALFPTKTVFDNVGFGLQVRGMPRGAVEQRVRDLAGMLAIESLLGRRAVGLSGGEQQRVALARALAPEPAVLLLDEPVSALDEAMRDQVLRELKEVQQRSHTTFLHVCHDFEEMTLVAERAAVLFAGQVAQVGPPSELLRQPVSERVARFMRIGNLIQGIASPSPDGCRVDCGGGLVLVSSRCWTGPVTAVIRSEDLTLHRGSAEGTSASHGRITRIEDRGSVSTLIVAAGSHDLCVTVLSRDANDLRVGAEVTVAVPPDRVHVMGGAQ